ncbi:MAG: lipoate--protein ligase family protein [Candidatus Caldatribacteriaceae bacterium]
MEGAFGRLLVPETRRKVMGKHLLRVLYDPPLSGYENMARDEALLEECQKPTLRFFSWEKETLSLGRYQRTDSLDFSYLEERDIPFVRRSTGGRAILHGDEVTFSLFLPREGEGYLHREFYERVREVVGRALEDVGIFVDGAVRSRAFLDSPACFSLVLPHELSVGRKKVGGIAQAQTERGNLFEASFPLFLDRREFSLCFRDGEKVYEELSLGFWGLREIKEDLEKEHFLERLAVRFGEWLGEVYRGEWQKEELERAQELLCTKYSPQSPYHLIGFFKEKGLAKRKGSG